MLTTDNSSRMIYCSSTETALESHQAFTDLNSFLGVGIFTNYFGNRRLLTSLKWLKN